MDKSTECQVRPVVTMTRRDISVNGIVIDRKAIAREAQNHEASKPVLAWQAAARALVIRQLLLQEAQRLHIAAEPLKDAQGRRETDDEAAIRALIDREVSVPDVSDENCRIYYDNNQARFRSKTLSVASHILVKADARDAVSYAQARDKADHLSEILNQRPDQFEAIAQDHSDCPSARQGGSLGQIVTGETTKAFELALDALAVGEWTSSPVPTPYGFHIIRLDRRIEGQALSFAQVRDQIADYLAESVQRRAQAQYIKILAGRAVIVGVEIEAAPGMMVQ